MDEKILKWFLYGIFGCGIIFSFIYFMIFVFSLLAEVKGFAALVILFGTIFVLAGVFNVLIVSKVV